MKRYHILSVLCAFLLSVNFYAQGNRTIDAGGNTIADDGVTKRIIKKDVFGNTVIEDNNGNKLTIGNKTTKKKDIFGNTVIESRGNKIKVGRDIFGYLEYEDNSKKASLKKDIFDAWIYSDSNGNEIKYSKEFWADIKKGFRNDEEKIFFWLLDICKSVTDFKEEYKVDIFGYLEYKNSLKETASLKEDIFDNIIYKDSKDNEIKYSKDIWNKTFKRKGSKYKAFSGLVHSYLYED